jgi:hypothetical protein
MHQVIFTLRQLCFERGYELRRIHTPGHITFSGQQQIAQARLHRAARHLHWDYLFAQFGQRCARSIGLARLSKGHQVNVVAYAV